MKINYLKKSLFGLALIPAVLTTIVSCSNNNVSTETTNVDQIKVATFNASLATDNDKEESLQRWIQFFSYTHDEQNQMIAKWNKYQGKVTEGQYTKEEKDLAERLMQIRNIAAIIQKNRPDVLLINEFNNDGMGGNKTMELFQNNYLKYGQSLNGPDGGDLQDPIIYPEIQSYATNTGLNSGMDLDNDGIKDNSPNDKFGFGYYHGHYAFGLMSKFPIDRQNTRTFQKFLWKDMKDENNQAVQIPKIVRDKDDKNKPYKLPDGMTIGDDWFSQDEWKQLRLSSKNHVDVPIIVNGKPIHLLLSHPTPPVFDTVTDTNLIRNRLEVLFWKHYIENQNWIYDDNGKTGGIDGSKEKFIIMGDLNADNFDSDNKPAESRKGIKLLSSSNLVNKSFVDGDKTPVSNGGKSEKNSNKHARPEARTSTFGLRVDWTLPSNNLKIKNSGVYWADENEPGRLLFNDSRVGQGFSKWISSDHRLVWMELDLSKK